VIPKLTFLKGLKTWEKITLALILVWTGLVFRHYFSFQNIFVFPNPFSDWNRVTLDKLRDNWVGSAGIFFRFSLISFTLWRWGRKLVNWLGLKFENAALRFCAEMGLAILFFNSLWLGLGLNLLCFGRLLWTLVLAFLAFAVLDFLWNYKKFQKFPKIAWPRLSFIFLGFLGILYLGFSFLQGLIPEVFFDGLVYHLSTLSFWEYRHGITDFYTNLYSYYPFGAELYFLNGFFFQGTEAAKTLNVLISGLCALAAAGWATREAGLDRGIMAWAMVLVFPMVSATVWTTQNDVFLAFFLLLFFYALNRWAEERNGLGWAVMAGILGGGALTVKYTALLGIASGISALILIHRETLRKKGWTEGLAILGFMILSLVPWFIKNEAYRGNGFYPYFSQWMGGRSLSPVKMSELMMDHEVVFNGNFSLLDWVQRVLTWDLDKTVGPLLFAFLPFLFLPGKRSSTTKYLLILSGLLLLSGFLVSHQLRLLIPAFITSFLAMVFLLGDLPKETWTRAWALVILLFGIVSLPSLMRLSATFYQSGNILLGKETRQEYLEHSPQTLSYFGLTREIGIYTIASDCLLIAGDARSLYYPKAFYANSVFDDQVLALLARREKDGDGIWRRLHEMGVDDLVVSGEEGIRLSKQYHYYPLGDGEWAKLDDFIEHWTDLAFRNDMMAIYHIRSTPAVRAESIPDLLLSFKDNQRKNFPPPGR
jgi:hypothetical protein